MAELKERIKDFAGDILYQTVLKKLEPIPQVVDQKGILLLPPSDLDGSFGDELMVCAFVEQFAQGPPVFIFTDHLLKRDDFLGNYPNVHYLDGFHVRNYNKWAEVLSTVSAIFIIGADAIDGSYSSRHSMRYLRLAEMAHRMDIAVHFSGFSVSKKATAVVKEALAIVSDYALLKARDPDSYQRLSSFVPKERILQVSDMAFVCPFQDALESENTFQFYHQWADRQHQSGKRILAVCPNSIQAEKVGFKQYLQDFERLLDKFRKKTSVAIAYLYHDIRPLAGGYSDKDISRMLYERSLDEDFFYDGIANGIELKSYLKYTDVTVTGRMHFGISGIVAGNPMFGICYANKFEGLLRLFEIDPGNALVDYTDMAQADPVIDRFLTDLQAQNDKIAQHITVVKQLSLLNGQDMRQS